MRIGTHWTIGTQMPEEEEEEAFINQLPWTRAIAFQWDAWQKRQRSSPVWQQLTHPNPRCELYHAREPAPRCYPNAAASRGRYFCNNQFNPGIFILFILFIYFFFCLGLHRIQFFFLIPFSCSFGTESICRSNETRSASNQNAVKCNCKSIRNLKNL